MADSSDITDTDERLRRVQAVAEEVINRRAAGELLPDEAVIAEHPDLMPELGEKLARIPDIADAVAQAGDVDASTIDHGSGEDTDLEDPPPTHLGRYEIRQVLGRGGFGVVYLAYDPQLDRLVALKVPRRKRFETAEQVQIFVKEARTAANLKHPLLVIVHDVQQEDGLPFIVQEYIDGQNLGDWAAEHRPSYEQIARVLVDVAEALGYAHQQGLTHCDLKLANVLMDTAGQPHVADFGLAVHESAQTLHKGEVFGTPAMMAPEQVRGESHRFDGRTDIWGIGVMLYQLLTGRRPFTADSRKELYAEIQAHDPKPPRQSDRSVPRELERICFKCLSKRRSHRYSTTDDLREDLLAWLGVNDEASTQEPQSTVVTPAATPDSSSGSKPPVKIIPKGLRSFDAEDADFFLELLPGPRDRDGLPDSIRFWKNRIEEPDPDKTFSVGLIYGPSGCGKSSLVKAGLLPRLSDRVLPIYVEATADDTEVRILKQLRKHIPRLSADITLTEACAELRLTGAGRNRKVLLVIDQFEQWLHSHSDLVGCQLVDALRQCEGGRLQAVVMVRDDFYASVNELFQELEERLLEGHNYMLVPRFSQKHATNVLAAFGRAYGALPDSLQPEQEQFLAEAVSQLAEDGQVISVRLALFADLMESRPWVPNSLVEVGGVGGIGERFLEETFAAKGAPPAHRVHKEAVQKVLKALLPQVGTDIKGAMQSADQLREAAGYQESQRQFEELINILDPELRLITPTDPEAAQDGTDDKYYQLTHDYLVPSMRDWLTRKQKETRRGRAELRLADRAATWNSRPENRHLPAWWEYLNIRLLTKRADWTPPQREMMRRAGLVHAGQLGIAVVLLLIVGIGARQWYASVQEDQVAEKIATLKNSLGAQTRALIDELAKFPDHVVKRQLQDAFPDADTFQQLQLVFALAEYDDLWLPFILSQAEVERGAATQDDVENMVEAFKNLPTESLAEIQLRARRATEIKDWAQKLRWAVLAMHLGDPTIAAEMLKTTEPDPAQRTVFIAEFPQWCGPVQDLTATLKTADRHVRSGFGLALGGIERPDPLAKRSWQPILKDWYVNQPDSGTHSASGWALRQWKIELPKISPIAQSPNNLDWWHTPVGLRMVKIPKGQVASTDRTIEITEPFWLSDQEVPVALFDLFIKETDPPDGPEVWEGAHGFGGKTNDSHPVQMVSWEQAVLFCNWLSRKHGLEPCYEVVPLEEPTRSQIYKVSLDSGVDGFRLPTADEWEYACRAGTTTDYATGDDDDRLRDYAIFAEKRTEPCGSRRCNAWGLFDMHGNVWEWCWDDLSSLRVYRGGGWYFSARDCQSSSRSRRSPASGYSILGFRVARGPMPK